VTVIKLEVLNKLKKDKMKKIIYIICLLIGQNVFADTRIINGNETEKGEFPWMVAIVYKNMPSTKDGLSCGGTLIHPSWVLTASHCVDIETVDTIKVIIGRHTLSKAEGEAFEITDIIMHPNYDYHYRNPLGDIALLKLDRPADSHPIVKIASPYDDHVLRAGAPAVVLGWGLTEERVDTSYSDVLIKSTVPLISAEGCELAYEGEIKEGMICAGYLSGESDACEGDSGGPLVVKYGNEWQQVGIVSWGEGCARADYYGVYTDVSFYEDFIAEYICSLNDVPSTPNLQVNVEDNEVLASWNLIENIDKYQFYYTAMPRRFEDLNNLKIHSFSVNKNTSLSASLQNGIGYYGVVRAYRGNCGSDYSNLGEARISE